MLTWWVGCAAKRLAVCRQGSRFVVAATVAGVLVTGAIWAGPERASVSASSPAQPPESVHSAPTIDFPPNPQDAIRGGRAILTVIAGGDGPLTYQWRKGESDLVNGERVVGATSDTLVLADVVPSDAGAYNVVVTNTSGNVTSDDVALTVRAPQAGDYDVSFNPGSSINFGVGASALQPDGRVLIAGNFMSVHDAARGGVARLNADGSSDHTFMNAMAGVDGGVNGVSALALQVDGRVVIGGLFSTANGVARNNIARLNADGSLDSNFQADTNGYVLAVELQADGRVLIGGTFTSVNGEARNRIARLNADGSLDTGFQDGLGGANSWVDEIKVQPDGAILISGAFTSVNGVARGRIARLSTAGTLDGSFQGGMEGANQRVIALALQPDGRVLLGGQFTSVNGVARQRIARLNTDGSLDTTFMNGLDGADDTVFVVTPQPDGRALVGGWFTSIQGTPRGAVARLDTNGALDETFQDGLTGATSAYTFALAADGSVVVGGFYPKVNGVPRQHVARLNADGSLDPGFDNGGTGVHLPIYDGALQADGRILIGGWFTAIGGQPRAGVARLKADGSLDPTFQDPALLGAGLDGAWVDAVVLQPDGRILIAGEFTSVGGTPRNRIARLNANGSLDTTFQNGMAGTDGEVAAIALQDDGRVLIAGDFTSVNGVGRSRIARLNADGSLDTSFAEGLAGADDWVDAIALQSDGRVLVGGWFTAVHATPRAGIARLNTDGSLDSSFLSGLDGADDAVVSIVVQPDGRPVVTGHFSTFNGTTRHRIARLNEDGTLDPGFQPSLTGASGGVWGLARQPDGRLLIGGDFVSGAEGRTHLARLEADGSHDTSFHSGLNGSVFAIHSQADGRVLAFGEFGGTAESPATGVARLYGTPPEAPVITLQPEPVAAYEGCCAVFEVEATGTPLDFQWRRDEVALEDGARITGANGPTLTICELSTVDAGNYSVVVSNVLGSEISDDAALTVSALPPGGCPVDLALLVRALNVTSVNNVTYRLGTTIVTTAGAAAQTPQILAVNGLLAGQHTIASTFGNLTIAVAPNGTVSHVSGPFTIEGSELIVQNTVDLGTGTLTVGPRYPTSFSPVFYRFRVWEFGDSPIGSPQNEPGTPTTPVEFQFYGMAPGMDFLVDSNLGSLHFKLNASGTSLEHGGSSFSGSQTPGELFTILGSTVTIENDVGFATLTVNAEQPTSASHFAAYIEDMDAATTSKIGPSATIPGADATSGVTLPFTGMTRHMNFLLRTTIGQMHLRLDANGDITFGTSTISGSGSYLLFSASGSTITVKNRAGFPAVRIRAAGPTSLEALSFRVVSYQGATTEQVTFGPIQTTPGAAAMTGVTVPMTGVLPFFWWQIQSNFGSHFFYFDENNVPVAQDSASLEGSGSTVTIRNHLNYRVRGTLDHQAATQVTWYLRSLSYSHAFGPQQTIHAGQLESGSDFEALGLHSSYQFLQVVTNFGSTILLINPDGTAVFSSPATNVSPTQGAIPIEGGTNTLYIELLPLRPRVLSVDPAPNSLNVSTATNVTVNFTELIQPATVTQASFRLLDPFGSPVPAVLTVDPSGLAATLDPTAALTPNTLYTIRLLTSVQDLDGNALVLHQSYFRTAGNTTNEVELPEVSTQTQSPPDAELAQVGWSVAAAGNLDEDGAGLTDILSGAPGYAVDNSMRLRGGGTATAAGAAIVYLGSADPAERATPDIIFEGVDAHDRTGVSVAGDFDFNGDGHLDLLIGAEQMDRTDPDSPVPTGPGKVYLIYFDPNDTDLYPNLGNPAVPDVLSLADVGTIIPGVVFTGASVGDRAGFSVAGMGLPGALSGQAILIGAPGVDATNAGLFDDAGAAYAIVDRELSATVSLADVACTDRDVSPCAPQDEIAGVVIEGADEGALAGFSVAFVGSELYAVGAPGASSGPSSPTGGGVVVAPRPDDDDTSIIVVNEIGSTADGLTIYGTQAGMRLGWAVADGGDALADGKPDLLAGAPGYDVDLLEDAGLVVHVSDATINGVHLDTDVGDTLAGLRWTGVQEDAQLGFAVAGVGDISGDGYDDIAMGAPFASPLVGEPPEEIAEGGAVYVAYGLPAVLVTEATIAVSDLGVEFAGQVFIGTSPNEHAGVALAGVGDMNGDGQVDFAVGASGFDNGAVPNEGLVYLVLESLLPPPGSCFVDTGCIVVDLSNGSELAVPAGALESDQFLEIVGVLEPGSEPAAPAGLMLAGRADLVPGGLALLSAATLHVATRPEIVNQIALDETLALYRCSEDPCGVGAMWIDTGTTGTVVVNPYYASQRAVQFAIDELHAYAVFLPDADGDGTRDGQDNCPVTSNPSQSDGDADGLGDVCDGCPGAFNPGQEDTDGDGAMDACDNCPIMANASQADTDGDTIGDACDSNPLFVVSSDPADDPDFATIQAAVDAVTQSGTLIRVLPGLGPYLEAVVVDRGLLILFEGYEPEEALRGEAAVIVDGGSMPAFSLLSTTGSAPMRFVNFTLRGAGGVEAAVGTDLRDVRFEENTDAAMRLLAGTHRINGASFDDSVNDALVVEAAASLELRRSRIVGIGGTAVQAGGSVLLENVLIAGADAGVILAASGSASLRHVTLADASGVGLDRSAGGTVTVSQSILWGNGGGDLVAVVCGNVSWSLVGSVDCSGLNDNLQTDPIFVGGGDWRLQPTSPALDHGPAPSSFTGTPCHDLDGRPRQIDWDGDGLAVSDLGAYEHRDSSRLPGAVTNLLWLSQHHLTWDQEGAAVEYDIYRGLLSSLDYGDFGSCRNDLDADRTDLQLTDVEQPDPGTGFFFLITAVDSGGVAGSSGDATCTERSILAPCP